jgi:hypothetical protein
VRSRPVSRPLTACSHFGPVSRGKNPAIERDDAPVHCLRMMGGIHCARLTRRLWTWLSTSGKPWRNEE